MQVAASHTTLHNHNRHEAHATRNQQQHHDKHAESASMTIYKKLPALQRPYPEVNLQTPQGSTDTGLMSMN